MKFKTYQFPFLLAAIFLLSCSSIKNNKPLSFNSELDKKAPVNTLITKEARNNWKLLFNGQDFAGWHGYNLKEVPDCWIIFDEGHITLQNHGAKVLYRNIKIKEI